MHWVGCRFSQTKNRLSNLGAIVLSPKEAYPHPHRVRGWSDLIERFKLRFAQGPIDWAQEVETNPDEHYSL